MTQLNHSGTEDEMYKSYVGTVVGIPGRVLLFFALLMLGSCTTVDNESDIPDSAPSVADQITPVAEPTEQELQEWEIAFRRQRLIGDLLYDALKALQEDKLLLPLDDNAHERYKRVLAIEADNPLALEGMQNIVARYLELSATASRQGRFDAALEYIQRARIVDRDSPAILTAQEALEKDRNAGDLVYSLDLQQLAQESPTLIQQLEDIADQAAEHNAFVSITAPSDEKGRWIYGTMRERVNGYRLRGNIEIGGFAIIRLRIPAGDAASGSAVDQASG